MIDTIDCNKVRKILQDFADDRDWNKFHTPKNISMAIAGEVGELVEIFQWLTEDESKNVKFEKHTKEKVSHEIADIFLYIVRLSALLDININEAIHNKIHINNHKYPKDLVKGSAKKYTEYNSSD